MFGNVNYLFCCSHLFIQTTGYLFAIGSKPKGVETKAAYSIDLTEELRALDGAIIECRYVDRRWFFVRVRNDCEYPNVHIWLSGT